MLRPKHVGYLFALSAISVYGCRTPGTSPSSSTQSDAPAYTASPRSSAELAEIAAKKVTCPFVGTAVATGDLPVLQGNESSLIASIDAVINLGDSGGGDLGRNVLQIFATGNHAFMQPSVPSGKLTTPVPHRYFSLDFPGSQGSHPGHSGILQGNHAVLDSGRFDEEQFKRLLNYAKGGHIKRSDFGRYIAHNLHNDPASKVFGVGTAKLLGGDLINFVRSFGPAFQERVENIVGGISIMREGEPHYEEQRQMIIALTKLAGEDNMVGSAGEFGLLFAFLAESPGTTTIDGEIALSVDDLTLMFRDKRFPANWKQWKKTSLSWLKHSTGLLLSTATQYVYLRASGDTPAINSEYCSYKTTVQACVASGNGPSQPAEAGDIVKACNAAVNKKFGALTAEAWNCRAACFEGTIGSQRQNCPKAQ